MGKRRRSINQKDIEKYIASGCGQGQGADYKPWLTIQDVPSRGLVNRIKGWKTGRVHHFFSELELNYFYVLEWSQVVCDIREQYPLLPLTQTQAIASECSFRHPAVGRTSDPVVMTTDFVVTMRQSIGTTEIARTLKYALDLQSKRTLEKLEIERLYWLSRGIDWGIVTEREIPVALVKNVAWFHPFLSIENLSPLKEGEIRRIARVLTQKVLQNNVNLVTITSECDDLLGYPPGTSLMVARHMLANRILLVDMSELIQPMQTVAQLNSQLGSQSEEAGGVG